MIPEKANLSAKLEQITEHWSPRVVAGLNGQQVKLAKLRGEFVWHAHDHECLVVPRGVEHRPVAEAECHVLLFEPAGTINTGNVVSERTVKNPKRI